MLAAALAVILTGCAGPPADGASEGSRAAPTAAEPVPPVTARVVEPEQPTGLPTSSPAPTPFNRGAPVETPEDFPGRAAPSSVTVPILLYHHLALESSPVRYTISAQRFEEQLDYLADHGYETITIQDLVNALRAGVPLPPQPVILTFDDGNQDLFELAFPRMRARGMVGVVYVVANRIGAEGFLSAESLQALHASGWEIGSHGLSHRALADLGEKDLAAEVADSKRVIEASLGGPIRSFAYPFGTATEESLLAAFEAGYSSGAGLGLWNVHRAEGLFYLSRREVHGTFELEQFAALLRPD